VCKYLRSQKKHRDVNQRRARALNLKKLGKKIWLLILTITRLSKTLKAWQRQNLDTLKMIQIPIQVNPNRPKFSKMNLNIVILRNFTKFQSVPPQQTSNFLITSPHSRSHFQIRSSRMQNNGNFRCKKIQTTKKLTYLHKLIKHKIWFKYVTSN
jgi:hypothetical protein